MIIIVRTYLYNNSHLESFLNKKLSLLSFLNKIIIRIIQVKSSKDNFRTRIILLRFLMDIVSVIIF